MQFLFAFLFFVLNCCNYYSLLKEVRDGDESVIVTVMMNYWCLRSLIKE